MYSLDDFNKWIHLNLYPEMVNKFSIVFPEFIIDSRFKGWIYWEDPKDYFNKDKLTAYSKFDLPGLIIDRSGNAISVIEYYSKKYGLYELNACEEICDILNLEIPGYLTRSISFKHEEIFAKDLISRFNSFLVRNLNNELNLEVKSETVKFLMERRGYSKEHIKKMGIGLLSSLKSLEEFINNESKKTSDLAKRLFSKILKEKIDEPLISIPYMFDDTLEGLKLINLEEYKYYKIGDLRLNTMFFNSKKFTKGKHVLAFEGELSCLSAMAYGFENTISIPNGEVHEKQVKDAISKGAETILLISNSNKEGNPESYQTYDEYRVDKVTELLKEYGFSKVFTAGLWDSFSEEPEKDFDVYLSEYSLNEFREVLENATPDYIFKANLILRRPFLDNLFPGREMTDVERDQLIDELVEVGSKISDPMDRVRFVKYCYGQLSHAGFPRERDYYFNISQQALNTKIWSLAKDRNDFRIETKLKSLAININDKLGKGLLDEAVDIFQKSYGELNLLLGRKILPPYNTFDEFSIGTRRLKKKYVFGSSELMDFLSVDKYGLNLIWGKGRDFMSDILLNLLLSRDELLSKPFYINQSKSRYETFIRILSIDIHNQLIQSGDSSIKINSEFVIDYLERSRDGEIVKKIDNIISDTKFMIDNCMLELIDIPYSIDQLINLLRYKVKMRQSDIFFIDGVQDYWMNEYRDSDISVNYVMSKLSHVAKQLGITLIISYPVPYALIDNRDNDVHYENKINELIDYCSKVLYVENINSEGFDKVKFEWIKNEYEGNMGQLTLERNAESGYINFG